MNYIAERKLFKSIECTEILSNLDIVKDENLVSKLMALSYPQLDGGIKAVWKYPEDNISDVVIAYHNGEPVGVVTLTNKKNQNIYVKPEFRKIGLASKMKDVLYNRK